MVALKKTPDLSPVFGPRGKKIVEDTIEALRSTLPIVEVWLFGSCARRTALKGSDMDLLVVLQNNHGLLRPTLECFKVVNHVPDPVPVDVIATSEAEWEHNKRRPFGVLGSVLREGICLYAA